ncbi:hypothetical protein PR202_ga15961 [Eleusine coracana subsp. coracana]|uniref:BED-type domain-containing protein n=1 Tax=Eleusine coracana subsp. coracana TaxID=191504 RepID=A0AAV5CLB6_ELECO|nr:hypothetical protein PR202_ga15961 [Eleusine coracana subsp. coracana]
MGMEEECQGPNFDDEKMVNGMEDIGENAYYNISEQDERTDSITSPQSSDIKLNKRLRSKVWCDFIPTFVHGKIARAECKRCNQVFNCSSSYGTGNLLKHQVKCTAAGTQKRPRLQEHTSLPSTQKSTALAGADPKQKKLPFFPSRQSKCLGTADAMPAQKLVFPDTRMEKNRTNQGVDQNGSHEEVAALEQKNIASAPVMQVGLDELEKFRDKSAKCSKSTVGPSPSVVQYPNCRYAPSREDWITAQKICDILGHFHSDMESMHNNPGPVDFYDKLWHVKRKIRSEADFYDQAGLAYMDKGFSNVLYKMQQKFKEC